MKQQSLKDISQKVPCLFVVRESESILKQKERNRKKERNHRIAASGAAIPPRTDYSASQDNLLFYLMLYSVIQTTDIYNDIIFLQRIIFTLLITSHVWVTRTETPRMTYKHIIIYFSPRSSLTVQQTANRFYSSSRFTENLLLTVIDGKPS